MEAEAAFNAPDAVLGNRFIKMFFHYDRHNVKSVKDRLGVAGPKKVEGEANKASEGGEEEEKAKKEEEKAQAIAAIKKNQGHNSID